MHIPYYMEFGDFIVCPLYLLHKIRNDPNHLATGVHDMISDTPHEAGSPSPIYQGNMMLCQQITQPTGSLKIFDVDLIA